MDEKFTTYFCFIWKTIHSYRKFSVIIIDDEKVHNPQAKT